MKRILISIAVVFCAQVAFQTYLAVERTDDDFAVLATPLERPIFSGQLALADLKFSEPTQIDGPMTIVHTRYISKGQRVQPVYAAYRKPVADPRPTVAIFKPVVITNPAKTPMTVADRREHPHEKRSFPSKALAVVKKPYEWLKAIASTFR